ncbi:hypothetical protein EVAR_65588_1 [Eumeta japonica]|uniref:Uncharacterized protein n=1 Tax=Eumeta variegata TaxID=151549 RepID=A0A4C1Z3Z4_EUMVA|nr:hypothetical protein EVAR_65588_1 [Eumeta japonica]
MLTLGISGFSTEQAPALCLHPAVARRCRLTSQPHKHAVCLAEVYRERPLSFSFTLPSLIILLSRQVSILSTCLNRYERSNSHITANIERALAFRRFNLCLNPNQKKFKSFTTRGSNNNKTNNEKYAKEKSVNKARAMTSRPVSLERHVRPVRRPSAGSTTYSNFGAVSENGTILRFRVHFGDTETRNYKKGQSRLKRDVWSRYS